MAVCPFAKWEPVPVGNHQPIKPSAVIVHSNAGNSGDLYNWWLTNPDGLQSHFQVTYDGTIYQYVDTAVAAYANVQANQYGISIESANSPEWQSIGFDADKWSTAQIYSIVKLCTWIESCHRDIPTVVCSDGVHGYGWHDEYAAWTTPGHVCPGKTRTQQFIDTIVPAVASAVAPEADMTPAEHAVLNATKAEVDRLIASNTRIEADLKALAAAVAALPKK